MLCLFCHTLDMIIKCQRPIITKDGIQDITFIFNIETLEFKFDDKDLLLLIDLYYKNQTIDIPEFSIFTLEK